MLIVGVVVGAVVGILPGLGGSATLAMLLPFTVSLPPTQAFALLIGVAAVVSTTGDLTSILVGIPGEPIATATVVDGHPMALGGEAARAVGASLASSLTGAIFGAMTLALTAPFALTLSRSVGSPELFMLAVLGISFMAPIAGGSRLKGLAAGGLGLMLATVGLDPATATPRFTMGLLSLWDGVGLIPVALGLYAIPEIVELVARRVSPSVLPPSGRTRIADGVRDVRRLWPLVLSSSAIGTILGLIPGVGANVSQWIAYGRAARRRPEAAAFGHGAVEGVIAPSAANNATLGGSLIPTVALGIPGGLLSAFLLSALIMKGLVPGPSMLAPEAEGGHLTLVFSLVWMLVAANVLAVALAWLSADGLVRITQIPAVRVAPFLLVLTFVGAFAERQAIADLVLTCVMAALGLAFVWYRWPRAPLLMGIVLGPLAENRFFLSMEAYGMAWLWRPGVLAIALAIVAGLVVPFRQRRDESREPETGAGGVGELLLGATLAVLVAAALARTFFYAPVPALFPRIIAAVTVALLVAVGAAGRGGAPVADRARGDTRPWAPVVVWIPIFLVAIWAFGFLIGAPLAILGYLTVAGGQKTLTAVALSGLSGVFLYVILYRLLSVPFPSGVLMDAAGAMVP